MPPAPLMMPPPGPAGPASGPTDNPGAMAEAMSKVREAVNLLEIALPGVTIGTPQHKAVIDAIQKLSKEVPASAAVPGVQATTLAGLQENAQKSAVLTQLARSMGQGPAVAPVQPPAGA